MNNLVLNLPNILTFSRLLISPVLFPILIVYFTPNIFVSIFFLLLASTDFFDGYFARKFGLSSRLGKNLDPVADKFLLISVLVSLVYIQRIYFYVAIIFILREFAILAMRNISLINGFEIEVSGFGKLKTIFQFIYIFIVLVSKEPTFLEYIFCFISLYFSIFSAVDYFKKFYSSFNNEIC